MEYLNSKIKDLVVDLTAVKKAKLLSDKEVRHTLSNLSRWELSLEKIKENKVEIDKDAVKATVDDEEIVKLKSVFDKLCSIYEGVKTDLITADKDRALYSLVKNVRNVAVYPPPFGGKPNKNIYTFKREMLDALEKNQIPERNKIEVIRKHLKGAPRVYWR